MIVKDLIKKLQQLPINHEILICNIEDDGDGDGMAPLFEIINVSEEKIQIKDKDGKAVLIVY